MFEEPAASQSQFVHDVPGLFTLTMKRPRPHTAHPARTDNALLAEATVAERSQPREAMAGRFLRRLRESSPMPAFVSPACRRIHTQWVLGTAYA
jgi:hypothetical protein